MALFWSVLNLSVAAILSFSTSSASESGPNVGVSTISSAPSVFPNDPLSSSSSPPAISPDISPLFPSPSDSSLPIIPSSPSPPNPDELATPAPDLAFPPSGSPPPFSVASQNSGGYLGFTVFLGLFIASYA